ncbi:lysozyme inhibitor LprI family protein [Paenibacillus agricola]|uniref:DUF1311 domain-containing protein n=1 Tax=Paenibacillus agricola TaxID=2716264 RepID=A0ABX0J998_9BACL|nr:lysozyme inhibitor LprI family protein [Paenibacillus agricola]NHN32732.1 DUF1311 domain-containing protein [Paenibacillus agricola]
MLKRLWLIVIIITLLTACRNSADGGDMSITTATTSAGTLIVDKNPTYVVEKPETSNNNKSSKEVQSSNDTVTPYGAYQLTDEFFELIRSNPIDSDYNKESNEFQNSKDFSTTGWLQLEAKYKEVWDKELNAVYNSLLDKLDQKQKALLVESQKGWLQNHLKESEFVQNTFIQGDPKKNIGTQGNVNLEIAIKNNLRDRTFQLMEYYYMLGGKLEF